MKRVECVCVCVINERRFIRSSRGERKNERKEKENERTVTIGSLSLSPFLLSLRARIIGSHLMINIDRNCSDQTR